MGLYGSTLRGLIEPRRLVPILAVALPILWAQLETRSPHSLEVGVAMIGLTLVLAPASYRALFGDAAKGPAFVRFALYVGLAIASVAITGVLLPTALGAGWTFLTLPSSLLVALGLFLVGGFGLGRDIELEASLRRERERAAELAKQTEQAQLLALRTHLDPHFLFNTLNAIAEWCREDGAAAEAAILELSSMLRVLLEGVRTPEWPLARDVELARALGELYAIRDAERFRFEAHVDETLLTRLVPPMLTLPLVENAYKHGPAKGHRGVVSLTIEAREGLRIRVTNPGPYAGRREGGDGLATLERRLALAYGTEARFSIADAGGSTVAEIVLPR